MEIYEVMSRYLVVDCPWCKVNKNEWCRTREERNDMYPKIHSVRITAYEDKLIKDYIKSNPDKFLYAGEDDKIIHHKRSIRFED